MVPLSYLNWVCTYEAMEGSRMMELMECVWRLWSMKDMSDSMKAMDVPT